MGTNTTPEKMRGFIIPTVNITKDNIWPAQSTYTEKNPRAGVAKPAQSYTGLTLSMAGEQSQDITVETIEGGTPGEKASFGWSGEDDVALGQNSNNVITDWKYFAFGSGTTFYDDFGACTTDDGTLYWVQERTISSLYTISVHRQKRDGAPETLQTLVNKTVSGSPNTTAKPAIAELKDGSLLVCYFDYTTTDQVNLFVWRSFDKGDNWTQVSRRAMVDSDILVGASGVHIDTTQLIVSDDIVTLMVGSRSKVTALGANKLVQYVSRDSGVTFFTLGNYGEDHAFPAGVALPDGQIGFAYVSATDTVSFVRIPFPGIAAATGSYTSEYQVDITSGAKTFASASGTTLLDGSVAIWYHNDRIFVAARATDNDVYGFVSEDLGDTWDFIAETNAPGIDTGLMFGPDSATNIENLKAVVWEGRTLLMMTTKQSIAGMFFGGWSDVQHPALVAQPARNQYEGFEANWIHNQLPNTSGHFSTTGAGSATILNEGLRINTTSSQIREYQYTGNIYSTQFYRFKMRVATGSNTTNDFITFRVQNSDGSFSYSLKLRFSISGFVVRDHSSQLASVSTDLRSLHEFMVFQDGTAVKVYHREWDEKQAKKWTETAVTLGTQAAGLAGRLEWGHLSISSFPFQSYWSEMHISDGSNGAPNSEMRGAVYPAYGSYTYIDEGLLLSAKDSPARAEDQYTIEPRYDFPVENIFHEVALSPRVVWRNVQDGVKERIAFFTDPKVQATAKSLGLSDVAGIHLSNINWRTAALQTWNGSSWDDLVTIDTSEGLSGDFKRLGSTLISSTTSKDFYLKYNEAVGWRAELTSGEDTFIVKIKQNSEGLFSDASDSKQCVLVFDTELTDPATLPTSGTLKLMPTSISLVADLFQDAAGAGAIAYGISIDVQDTLEGYYQIGTMVFGNVYFMAPQYQRGRSITYDVNVQSYETNDGQYYARKMSDGRRAFRVGWTEPVDTRTIHALNPDFWEYSTAADARPVAHYGDAIFGMMGIANYLSEQKPLIYLPAMSKQTGEDATELFNRYHNHALVRVNGAVSMESVLGEEQDDEMFRLATVNLVEIE